MTEPAVTALFDPHGRRVLYRLVRLAGIPLLTAVFRIEIRGRQLVPPAGPFVVAANHLNWIDPLLVLMAFPRDRRVNFTADATFMTRSRFNWFLGRLAGGILPVIESGHGERWALHSVHTCLAMDGSVGFFPEGRYGDDELIPLRFHLGFARAAIDSHVPVIPVRVSGTRELWLRRRIRLEIGVPIDPAGHSLDSLARATRTRIMSMPPLEPAPGPRRFRRLLTRLFP